MEPTQTHSISPAQGPLWYQEWLKRHQHPVSYALHMVGIPLTLAALGPLLWDPLSFQMWCWAALLFLSGYALQFLGHAIEGNDAGELILIKKWVGLPYTAISPKWGRTQPIHVAEQ
jgi:hypothetical protein